MNTPNKSLERESQRTVNSRNRDQMKLHTCIQFSIKKKKKKLQISTKNHNKKQNLQLINHQKEKQTNPPHSSHNQARNLRAPKHLNQNPESCRHKNSNLNAELDDRLIPGVDMMNPEWKFSRIRAFLETMH